MGYFELYCQLCGVSFSIARIRRPDEPESAGWSSNGSRYVSHEEAVLIDDCEDGDCEAKQRENDAPEHIAGIECAATHGYSGHRITLEEMRECRAVQCLLDKFRGWELEEDDQDFERDSQCFLTGIADGPPNMEMEDLQNIQPARHGMRRRSVSNMVSCFVPLFDGPYS